MEPTFKLNNLRVEISPKSQKLIGDYQVGDYFDVIGENIYIPEGKGVSIYALAALIPLLPAKQRAVDPFDWMNSDNEIIYPDPGCHIIYDIKKIGEKTFVRSETTYTPLPDEQ
jgi:uncharacterized repeat protein (TIGR04076 family)